MKVDVMPKNSFFIFLFIISEQRSLRIQQAIQKSCLIIQKYKKNERTQVDFRSFKEILGKAADLFFKHKINRKNQKDKSYNMVQPKSFGFESNERKSSKYN